MDSPTTMHRLAFWGTCAALPVYGFVRAALSPSGDTPILVVGVVFAIYTALLAMLFFPTYLQATKWCDRTDRAVTFTVISIVLAHLIAIGGAIITDSNAFLLVYLVVGTASLMVLRKSRFFNTDLDA